MGNNGIGVNRGRGNNWQRGNRRPRFSIHFDVDPQELNHLFQYWVFNLVGQGILQPRPERPPFQPHQNSSSIRVPPHVSMQPKPPANDVCQEIIHQPVEHHNGWPTVSFPFPPPPPPFNTNAQVDCIASPTQSSHASKRLKTTMPEPNIVKGKKVAKSPNSFENSSESVSSHLHLKDIFSHVIIEIHPQGSNQPKAATEGKTTGRSKERNSEKRQNTSHKNMVFNVVNAIFV
jgi:hypothetical protein